MPAQCSVSVLRAPSQCSHTYGSDVPHFLSLLGLFWRLARIGVGDGATRKGSSHEGTCLLPTVCLRGFPASATGCPPGLSPRAPVLMLQPQPDSFLLQDAPSPVPHATCPPLRARKIPIIIRRYLPDGSYEDWGVDELIITD